MIIETGLVKTGLVKTGLVRAISNINQRYFRRNEGTTDYAQFAAPIVLTGAFKLSVGIWSSNQATQVLLSTLVGSDNWLASFSDGRFEVKINGSSLISASGSFSFNVENRVIVERDNLNNVSVSINETQVITGTLTGGFTLDSIYRGENSAFNTNGIPANLKIWDNGALVTDCPIDEPSGATIIDHASGNNATIINGLDSDRQLYTQQETGEWLGQANLWTGPIPFVGMDTAQFGTMLFLNDLPTTAVTYRLTTNTTVAPPNMAVRYAQSGVTAFNLTELGITARDIAPTSAICELQEQAAAFGSSGAVIEYKYQEVLNVA